MKTPELVIVDGAPERLHEELSVDAGTKQAIEAKRKAFIRKWRLKCRVVADSLEEAGDKLFTFTRFPESQAIGRVSLPFTFRGFGNFRSISSFT